MKKILLSAVALMAFGLTAQAQEMNFGLKAGANFANVGGDAEDTSMRTAFHVGAFSEFKLSEQFSIQPELVYSMQGFKSDAIEGFTSEEDIKLDYLNIPIMAKYYLMEGLSLHAGPQVGFLISAKVDDEDIKDSYKSIDFGLAGGVEYELPIGLFLQARYYAGIADITEPFDAGFGEIDENVTNNVISVSVGFKF